MARTVLAPKDLLAYSGEHLYYEIEQLLFKAVLTRTALPTIRVNNIDATPVVRNSLIESFATHLRNLIGFFYDTKPYPTDVIAGDFYASGQLPAGFPPISDKLTNAKLRQGKEIGHMSSELKDADSPEKRWDHRELIGEIAPALRFFARTADSDRLSPKTKLFIETVLK
jgi:hypothetical protein